MTQTIQSEYLGEYEERVFAETPFVEPRYEALEGYVEPQRGGAAGEALTGGPWSFETPFETSPGAELGESVLAAPEVAALAEMTAELKDHLFRESLEALATSALETHAQELAGEYGDREQYEASSARLLSDHFAPLSEQMESSLDRLFERLESFEVATLTEAEIDRAVSEISPPTGAFAPAAEQFLGGLLKKAGKLVSGAVKAARNTAHGVIKLAGKGLAAVGKLALGPLLAGLKRLGSFLLEHVVKFALGQLPPALQPLGRQLSEKLFHAINAAHENELADHEQTETEGVSAGVDVARLEAEFDVAAAQLLLVPEEAEAELLAERYGETEGADGSLRELDDARARFVRELATLETGESAQPVMEQFLPALLWPVAKTALTMFGRRKVVNVIANLLSGLIKPMIGAQPAGLLGPAIADAGLRIFGLESEGGAAEPRSLTAEALAATVEETINRVAELPPSALENETLVESAVREAFEDAAATYFPGSHIKPELRETEDGRGVWMRMPHGTPKKRYAKYSDSVPVEISPRLAGSIRTFGGGTLGDHMRDRMDVSPSRAVKTKVRLYQVLPGATTSSIARAEGIHPRDLHPLTSHAAGALLGPNGAGLGPRSASPAAQTSTPHHLHLRQRLYYVEPPGGRKHHARRHAHSARTEVSINLRKGEIKLWLYLSEPLAQKVAAELAKARNASGAHRLVHPLVVRATDLLKSAVETRHLPPALRIVGDVPNLKHRIPSWLPLVGAELAGKIGGWAAHQVAQYLRNNGESFRKLSASEHEGVTLRITMSRVPGIEVLRQIEKGAAPPRTLNGAAWLRGDPVFEVIALPGHAIR